jgi:acetate kinase
MSHILVLNCGSSSVKFALINLTNSESVLTGLAEAIGSKDCRITFKSSEKINIKIPNGQYRDVFNQLKLFLENGKYIDVISGVGHRVVHGGSFFSKSVVINDSVLNKIEECVPLAPLHNPANIEGIKFCQNIFPNLKQVAVFDTAFHQTIPQHISEYAIPRELTDTYHIKKYGFHGTSHQYISEQASKLLNINSGDFIVAHLGNGCSVTAVVDGKSMDTSMGFTPLDGLIMGTRSGTIDPGVFDFIHNALGKDIHEISNILNKKSGVLGICGHSDMREIGDLASNGDEMAILAIKMFSHRVAKFISSYMIYFKDIDALVFTGGIGENSSAIREQIVSELNSLGFVIDFNKNSDRSSIFINQKNSKNIMVIATDEELMIAKDTQALI